MSSAKDYGTAFETDVVGYLRGAMVSARRIARSVPDEGDVVIGEHDVVAQLKARRDRNSSLSLGAWLKSAKEQAEAYGRANNLPRSPLPVLIVKNPRGSGSTGKVEDSFVIMYLKDWIEDESA